VIQALFSLAAFQVFNEMIMILNFVSRLPILNTLHTWSMFSRDIHDYLKIKLNKFKELTFDSFNP
jgi:hypothetical protein